MTYKHAPSDNPILRGIYNIQCGVWCANNFVYHMKEEEGIDPHSPSVGGALLTAPQ